MALPFVPAAWKALWRGLLGFLTDGDPMGLLGIRVLWVAGLWFVAAGLGGPIARALGLGAAKAELFLLTAGLGFGAISLALLGLGLVDLFSPTALAVAFGVLAAASLVSWFRWYPAPEPSAEGPARTALWERLWAWPVLALLALAGVIDLLCAACPEIYYDSLNYHLALPSLYLMLGRVEAVPHHIFSSLPFGGQMLYGLCLALKDEKLASLLHVSFSAGAAAFIFLIGRRWISRFAGLLAALLYYTVPLGMYSSWSCGVDHIGVFYCCAGLYALLRGLETPGLGWPVGAGLLLGYAAGTKYNILTMPVVAACVQAWADRGAGRGGRSAIERAGVLLAASAAVFLPWMARNLAVFQNPLYPFLTSVLPGAERIADPVGFFSASRAMDPAAVLSSLEGLRSWGSQLWQVFLGDWPTGDWPGPLLPLFAPWLLFVPWKRPAERALLACGLLGFLAWAATSGLGRFLLPAYPALVLVLAFAVCHPRWPGLWRGAGLLAILYGCLFQVQVAFKQSWNMDFWGYLAGRISREDFILKPHETYALPYYSAARVINKELPPDATVLVLGESRTFYIGRPTVAASIFDHNPFWEAVRRSRSPAELRARLADMGVTHILVNAYQYMYRASSSAVLPRDLASSEVYRRFWQEYLEVLYEDRHDPNPQPGWLVLYRVLPEPRTPPGTHTNPAFAAVNALRKVEAGAKR
jgi:hypothetical protein